jgi:ElaB/YqjD/DUF883 family membrane-anchored ribosome-binding protein
MANESISTQRVVDDFSTALKDAEVLLQQVGTEAGDKAATARARLQEKLREAKYKPADLEAAALDRTKAMARATDDFAHEHPWRLIGVALAIGLVVGLLLNRR